MIYICDFLKTQKIRHAKLVSISLSHINSMLILKIYIGYFLTIAGVNQF